MLGDKRAGQPQGGTAGLRLVLRSGRRGRRFKSGHPTREPRSTPWSLT